jgi:hypothetical protein
VASLALALFTTAALTPESSYAAGSHAQLVEFELMTWPEVRDALAAVVLRN